MGLRIYESKADFDMDYAQDYSHAWTESAMIVIGNGKITGTPSAVFNGMAQGW